MYTRRRFRLDLPHVMIVSGLLAACHAELPMASEPELRAGMQVETVLASAHGDEHEEPDPRTPPRCHGITATIWYNMPADLVPDGVIIRPVVRGDDHEHEHVNAADVGHDEASGYVIVGTSAHDVIVGSSRRDSILGGNGNDLICADPVRGGEDAAAHASGQGGGGPDHVWGGNGDDTIYGGGGPDSLYGGNGNDTLNGGGGPDALYGENGDDTLDGGVAPDLLDGGRGNDRLIGGLGNDTLLGGAGDDELLGGNGRDVLDGGTGQNVLDAGDQSEDDDDHGGHS